MIDGVGVPCLICKKTLFGVAWLKGKLVMFSNCMCGGQVAASHFPLDKAIDSLGPENKRIDESRVDPKVISIN